MIIHKIIIAGNLDLHQFIMYFVLSKISGGDFEKSPQMTFNFQMQGYPMQIYAFTCNMSDYDQHKLQATSFTE